MMLQLGGLYAFLIFHEIFVFKESAVADELL